MRFLSVEVHTFVLESHVLNLSIADSIDELILLLFASLLVLPIIVDRPISERASEKGIPVLFWSCPSLPAIDVTKVRDSTMNNVKIGV
jgi:hypothetical protein